MHRSEFSRCERVVVEYFCCCVAVILFVLASFNLLGAVSPVPALSQPDTIFQINGKIALHSRAVLAMAGLFKLGVSGYLLVGKNAMKKLGLISWVTWNLLLYQLFLHYIAAPNFGYSLGNLYDWCIIPPKTFGFFATAFSLVSFSMSVFFLIRNWLLAHETQRKSTQPTRNVAGMRAGA